MPRFNYHAALRQVRIVHFGCVRVARLVSSVPTVDMHNASALERFSEFASIPLSWHTFNRKFRRKMNLRTAPNIESSILSLASSSGPRFGPGELPAEYLPLNSDSLVVGEQFGPLPFRVSERSHQHHLEYTSHCRESAVGSDRLYPFEFWPLPRVLSQWRFGRLNEVISVRATREVKFRPKPEEALSGRTGVRSVENQRGLCFGFFESETENAVGAACMRATDTLLLVNGCVEPKLREAVSKAKAPSIFADAQGPTSILDSWTLRMRFSWPTEKWRNNIHTDEYARSLGYERALVEGPGIVDVVCSFHESHRGPLSTFRLAWKYVGPLYEGLHVALLERPSGKRGHWSYLVCELPTQVPGQCRAILSLELEEQ